MKTKVLLLATIALAGMVPAAPASAQTADVRTADEDTPTARSAGDIIVTARKREESILKVPVIAAAIDQESLVQFGTNDLFAVANRIPGIQLGTSVNSVGTQLSIRGIGTTALNQTVDQSTSLNIDGLSLSQGLAYSAGMFDVAQVEVLKGPQALFFGKNSPAGVISLRSADPTDELEVIGRVGYEFKAKEKLVEAIVSGPVTNTLGLRLAGRFSDMSGWMRNVAQVITDPTVGAGAINPTDRSVPDLRSFTLRGTALFRPSDAYSARLKINFVRDEDRGAATPLDVAYCPEGSSRALAPTNIPFILGDDCKLDNKIRYPWPDPAVFQNIRNNGVPFSNITQWFGTLEQDLNLSPGITLTSVTGYYNVRQEVMHLASTVGTAVPIVQDNSFRNRQYTQEVRLTSDFKDKPFNFMVGGFYQDGYMMNHVRVPSNPLLFGGATTLLSAQHKINIESISLFGQVLYKLTDQLELAAGARWTDEHRTHRQFNTVTGTPQPTTLLDPKLSSSNISPEVSLTYTPTDDLTIFASYKQGFKSGSFNSATFINATTPASFNDEKVEGAEAGIKARMLDRSLNVNLAGYYYHYSDLQVGALELQQLPAGQGVTYALRTINAATANVYGVEFDATYSPRAIEGLTLNLAANWNHATYGSFPNAPCGNGQTAAQGCDQLLSDATGRYTAQDLSGRRLVRAPRWNVIGGFDYTMPVGRDMKLVLGGNANYTSRYATTLVDLPGMEQSGFAKIDANLALRGPEDRWELALIGKNLTNKYTTAWCINTNVENATVFGGQVSGGIDNGPAGQDEAVCSVERGRELWVRLSFKL
jgi:outer membrane receptor protein involved in Fe transport